MDLNHLAVIVLAAGKGTRFGENYTKLLHPIFDRPLVYYPIQNLKNLNVQKIFVVVSDPKVEEEVKKYLNCTFVYMEKPTGTADAVKLTLSNPSFTSNPPKALLVLNGDDATLYSKKTLEEFLKSHETSKAPISMMTLKTNRQMEVGRIIRDKNNHFSKILEYKEYEASEVKSNEINCGVYLINLDFAKTNLPKIKPSGKSGEYYLTDLLNIAKEENQPINLYILKEHSEWIGINDKQDLKYAENIIKKRNIFFEQSEQIQSAKSVHFLGIAGSGTSACAKLAEAAGFKVSGCDKNLSGEFAEILENIPTVEGHDPSHLENIDILAVTPAVLSLDPNNPELLEAKKRKIKILTWQQFLGKYLTKKKFVIAVCGTHGKSTTTAMIGKILEDANFDPTVILGATTPFWKANYRLGKSKYLVVEADEFNDNYQSLTPDISILTNLEFDHPEFFKDFASYQSSFRNFLAKTKHLIIANLNEKNSATLLQEKEIIEENLFPPVVDFSKNQIDFPLKVSGQHNILNASAAFNLALNLEISPEKAKHSLQNFSGIGRRMELIGEINGAKIFSDFAHHPTAVKTATEEIQKTYPHKQIWLVYQPHMFSRTKALFNEFVETFKNLKVAGVSIIDIYPSREKDTGLIHSKDLVKAINKPNIKYNDSLEEIFKSLHQNLSENVIVIFMGAGDIDSKIKELLKANKFQKTQNDSATGIPNIWNSDFLVSEFSESFRKMDYKTKKVLNSEQSEQSKFRNKRVLILGLGLNEGGVGSAKFFAKNGADVLVTDIKTKEELAPSIEKLKNFSNIKYALGGHKNEDIDWADIVIRNQALRPNNPFLMYARKKGKLVRTDIGLFLESINPEKIIGVTGTKGKSTTSSLIYEIIKEQNKKVIIAGNIGKSVLDSTSGIDDDTLVVLEISSFQLESFDVNFLSPKYALITNIYPDHLNYYQTMQNYINAKKLIAKHQSENDYLFLNKNDPTLNSPEFLKDLKSQIILFSPEDLPKNFKPLIPGDYNLTNFAAAFAVSKKLNLDENKTLKTMTSFKGVKYRMELVKDWNGIKIYNNTTATAPEPAIESLKTFPNCILIAGGMNKGLDYKEFAKAIDKYAREVYFLEGDATKEILNFKFQLRQSGGRVISNLHGVYNNLTEILKEIKKTAVPGDVVLFSPGATSFNLFQNEFDRGRRFNQAVENIFT